MATLIRRALIAALAGAALGVTLSAAATAIDPAIVLEMDRRLPPSSTGFYGLERNGDESFAWTSERAVLRFSGLDRSTPWTCGVRFRGSRPPELVQPTLQVEVDGVTVA